MALDVKTFRVRATTAIFFVIVMLAGLFINWWSFVILFFIITVGCLIEFNKILNILKPDNSSKFRIYSIPYIIWPFCCMIGLGTIGTIVKAFRIPAVPAYSPLIPCTIVFSIWINDTMAYLVGSFIGKTPFSKISPKKTWEGTIGGAILCVLIITGLSRFLNISMHIPAYHFMIISMICAVFGTIGDLIESKMKRMAGIKDSGNILPGHGGFLDRFDSLLIAVPFVWLYVTLFTEFF